MENPLAEHEAAQAALPYPAIRKIGINMRLSWRDINEYIHTRRYGAFLRRSHDVVTPVPDDVLRSYDTFKVQWEVLRKFGEERNFLGSPVDDPDDYDRSYEPYVLREPQPHIETVYDETEEEFEARVDASYASYNETGEWIKGTEPVISRRFTGHVDTLLDPWFGMLSEEVAEYQKNYKW